MVAVTVVVIVVVTVMMTVMVTVMVTVIVIVVITVVVTAYLCSRLLPPQHLTRIIQIASVEIQVHTDHTHAVARSYLVV
jgi:hypothetical protein